MMISYAHKQLLQCIVPPWLCWVDPAWPLYSVVCSFSSEPNTAHCVIAHVPQGTEHEECKGGFASLATRMTPAISSTMLS